MDGSEWPSSLYLTETTRNKWCQSNIVHNEPSLIISIPIIQIQEQSGADIGRMHRPAWPASTHVNVGRVECSSVGPITVGEHFSISILDCC